MGRDEQKTSPSLAYKGTLKELKGLLKERITEGLSHVVAKSDDSSANSEEGVSKIAIEKIYPRHDQPRQVFEPTSLEELSSTMKELGQAQAITVRKKGERYEIISGERRFRAAKLAGLSHLDCLIKEVDSKDASLLALVENVQRRDLLPIEEAHFLKKILDENEDLSLDRLAKMIGSHKSTVSEKVQLTEIPEELQPRLYKKGQNFTHRHWRVLSRIKDPEFLKEMTIKAVDHHLSVAELERSLEAAGITKSRRKRETKQKGQLSFAGFEIFQKSGSKYKLKSLTFDLRELEEKVRQKLIGDLEKVIEDLRNPSQESAEIAPSEIKTVEINAAEPESTNSIPLTSSEKMSQNSNIPEDSEAFKPFLAEIEGEPGAT